MMKYDGESGDAFKTREVRPVHSLQTHTRRLHLHSLPTDTLKDIYVHGRALQKTIEKLPPTENGLINRPAWWNDLVSDLPMILIVIRGRKGN